MPKPRIPGTPLRDPRWEAFCQHLLTSPETKLNQTDCFEKAGYERNSANANRLWRKPAIQERLAELQAELRKNTKITVETICAELDEAVQLAKRTGQPAAMVSASALRAKLAGLMTDKVQMEVTHKYAEEFPEGMQPKDILAKVVGFATGGLSWWHTVTEEDKAEIAAFFEEAWVKAEQLCKVIEARPIDTKHLPPPPDLPRSPNPSLNGKSDA